MAGLEAGESLGGRELRKRLRLGLVFAGALALAAFAVSSACQFVGGYASFKPHPCNVLPASKFDENGLNTLVLSKQSDESCFWIDETEVTVERYSTFLAAYAQAGGGYQQIPWDKMRCTWKTGPSDPVNETSDPCTALVANAEDSPFLTTKPIRCVDWCDAKAFCVWAGKDLCSGQPNVFGGIEPQDLSDQWGGACATNAGDSYPYGSVAVSGVCNVGLSAAGQCRALDHQAMCAPTAVDDPSFRACTGGPGGAVDMIGNVAEWVQQCATSDAGPDPAPDTPCQHRGGSFDDTLDSPNSTCYGVASHLRRIRDRAIGLRCCAHLTTPEYKLAFPTAP